jgi:uncharacterized membrane protein
VHPLRHPRNVVFVGLIFIVIALIYWATAYSQHEVDHRTAVDYAGFVMLGALGIAMGLMFYVLVAGSPRD